MASEKIIYLTDDSFDRLIEKSEQPVFVDFWANWCGPCRAMAPVFERLSQSPEYEGKLTFAKVDIDQCQEVSKKMRIMSIPTLILFREGLSAEKLIGLRSEEELRTVLDKYVQEPEETEPQEEREKTNE